jgi:hypothetical protein
MFQVIIENTKKVITRMIANFVVVAADSDTTGLCHHGGVVASYRSSHGEDIIAGTQLQCLHG